MRIILLALLTIALVGCISPPPEGDCITKEELMPGAVVVSPEDVSGMQETGFSCVPYEIDYCAGQCEGGVCPEPGIYSYQCWVEI